MAGNCKAALYVVSSSIIAGQVKTWRGKASKILHSQHRLPSPPSLVRRISCLKEVLRMTESKHASMEGDCQATAS